MSPRLLPRTVQPLLPHLVVTVIIRVNDVIFIVSLIIVITIDLLDSVQLIESNRKGSDRVVDERRRCVQVPVWHLAHTHLLQVDFVVVVFNKKYCKIFVVLSKFPFGTSSIPIS